MAAVNIEALFLIIFAHVVAETALQPTFMSAGKRRSWSPAGNTLTVPWHHWLAAHAMINAGCIYLATGSLVCGLLELTNHAVIDGLKSWGLINNREDRALHGLFLFVYWVFIGGV